MNIPRCFLLFIALSFVSSCGGSAAVEDDHGTAIDTTPSIDTTPDVDTAPSDPGTPADEGLQEDTKEPVFDTPEVQDAKPLPNGYLETVFGVINGACGLIGPEITSPEPSFFKATYTFRNDFIFNIEEFSEGPQARFAAGNAGGSSSCSEIISMQFLIDCQKAVILKTENEILYRNEGKETDFLASIEGQPVGVSVTRAYKGPVVTEYSLDDAIELLEKKLDAVNESSQNVHPDDAWVKQILSIWTLHPDWADTVEQAWIQMGDALKADTILLMIVEENSTMFVQDECSD